MAPRTSQYKANALHNLTEGMSAIQKIKDNAASIAKEGGTSKSVERSNTHLFDVVKGAASSAETHINSFSRSLKGLQKQLDNMTSGGSLQDKDIKHFEDLTQEVEGYKKALKEARDAQSLLNAESAKAHTQVEQVQNKFPNPPAKGGGPGKTGMQYLSTFGANAGVPGMGLLGSASLGLGLAAVAGMAVQKSITTSLAINAKADPMRLRGMNMDSILNQGYKMGMYGRESADLTTSYARQGGMVSDSKFYSMAKFSRGFGMSAEEAGGAFGGMAGTMVMGERNNARLPEMIAGAFAKGLSKADLPNFLENLNQTLQQLNQTLPGLSENQVKAATALTAGMYVRGNGMLSTEGAGRMSRGILAGMAAPRTQMMSLMQLMQSGGLDPGTMAAMVNSTGPLGSTLGAGAKSAIMAGINGPGANDWTRIQSMQSMAEDPGLAIQMFSKIMPNINQMGGLGYVTQFMKESFGMKPTEAQEATQLLGLTERTAEQNARLKDLMTIKDGAKTLNDQLAKEAKTVTGIANRIGAPLEHAALFAGDVLIKFAGKVLNITPGKMAAFDVWDKARKNNLENGNLASFMTKGDPLYTFSGKIGDYSTDNAMREGWTGKLNGRSSIEGISPEENAALSLLGTDENARQLIDAKYNAEGAWKRSVGILKRTDDEKSEGAGYRAIIQMLMEKLLNGDAKTTQKDPTERLMEIKIKIDQNNKVASANIAEERAA